MRSSARFLLMAAALMLLATGVYAQDYSDSASGQPEITARVARISKLKGDAQIRRRDALEWEQADDNLPLVEGDELVTSKSARIEIQFDRNTYLWLDGDAGLKIETLTDQGIAVSVPRGSAAVKIINFDKSRSYFEIDAPSTTIAVERDGLYRIDAGYDQTDAVLVSALEGGQARIYSQTAGMTLYSGRRARILVTGNYAGETEVESISSFDDKFADWIGDRQKKIDSDLASAYYGKYYDDDMYGAEDLDDYGQWNYTSSYGYVWRPYGTAISSYSNWSPYRYGQWRWLPPYGWTWVNDEPWGWATYHHGRWIWLDGYWGWTPYGYYRSGRSWWRPALVYMTVYNNDVCWYPLPYHYGYYNYNSHWNNGHYGGNGGGNHYPGNGNGNGGGGHTGGNPTPSPTPGILGPGFIRDNVPPLQTVPTTGVVAVSRDQFGSKRPNIQPPLDVAKSVVKTVREGSSTPPLLPPGTEINGSRPSPMSVKTPATAEHFDTVRTGAATRTPRAPLDNMLRKDRILGGRETLTPDPTRGRSEPNSRPTGAVERPPLTIMNPRPTQPRSNDQRDTMTPVRPRTQQDVPREQTQPRYEPRPQVQPRNESRPEQPQPRYEPRPQVQPRNDSRPQQPQPRYEPRPQPAPRNESRPQQPQPRYEPRPQPAPRNESKPQPPSERKAAPSAPLSREKDGKRQ
ncbi:MAG TPA: FecR domain-containing protein [Pyrinomonadaceae bacterium]|nr:FecR domain-containing protein [Pyrinomonadaceae bacterium]